MADRIIYTARTNTNEFQASTIALAAFSKEELDTLAGKAWTNINKGTIQPHVVDPEAEARAAISKLSPIERVCLRDHFIAQHKKG